MTGRKTTRPGEALMGIKSQAGEKLVSFKHTLAADPEAVTFAEHGLPDMLDADYRVWLGGEMAASLGDGVYVDESTIAKTGFSIVGGTGAEIAHVFVHGNVAE